MTNQSRLKAVAGEKYIVGSVEYIAVDTLSGCKGCAMEFEKCVDFPICTDADLSVIFKEIK